jgi:hypothetical protein
VIRLDPSRAALVARIGRALERLPRRDLDLVALVAERLAAPGAQAVGIDMRPAAADFRAGRY